MKACSFHSMLAWLVAVAVGLALAGCASQRPVLYPNAKYNQVGPESAQRDVDDCIRLGDCRT